MGTPVLAAAGVGGGAAGAFTDATVHRFPALSQFAAIVTLVACASSGATAGARAQPDLITTAEIANSGTTKAWDADQST
jgi:hypothetical protein